MVNLKDTIKSKKKGKKGAKDDPEDSSNSETAAGASYKEIEEAPTNETEENFEEDEAQQQYGDDDENQHEDEKQNVKEAVQTIDAVQEDETNLLRKGFNKAAQKISGNEDIQIYGPDQAILSGIHKACDGVNEKIEAKLEDEIVGKALKVVGTVVHGVATGINTRIDNNATLLHSSLQSTVASGIQYGTASVMDKGEGKEDKSRSNLRWWIVPFSLRTVCRVD